MLLVRIAFTKGNNKRQFGFFFVKLSFGFLGRNVGLFLYVYVLGDVYQE